MLHEGGRHLGFKVVYAPFHERQTIDAPIDQEAECRGVGGCKNDDQSYQAPWTCFMKPSYQQERPSAVPGPTAPPSLKSSHQQERPAVVPGTCVCQRWRIACQLTRVMYVGMS